MLSADGEAVHQRNMVNETALHHAAMVGSTQITQLLIEGEAEVEAKNCV